MNESDIKADDQRTINHFTELASRYGVDARSLDWGSRESQRLRFAILAQVGSMEGARVLDVGCGMGDFYGWLRERGGEVDYHGIDITPVMIDTARRRFPEARFDIGAFHTQKNDIEEPFEYVVASGIFYYRQASAVEFMHRTITAMFSRCTQAVSFNSLSLWSPQQTPEEFYADPLDVLVFCRTLTPWVVLRHDYHRHDFTIYMYRAQKVE
jgi:SAM-dependent methyltransferase